MADIQNAQDTLANVAKNIGSLSGRPLMSTAQMMLMLEMAKSSLVQSAGRDAVQSQLTRIESIKTKFINALHEDAPQFDDTLTRIGTTLSEVAKSQSSSYNDLATRSGGSKKEVDRVKLLRKELNNETTQFSTRKDQVAADVRNAHAKGKSSTEVKTLLAELEQTQRSLLKKLNDLVIEEKHVQKNLYSLHLDTFNAVPATARGNLPTPQKGSETTPRLG